MHRKILALLLMIMLLPVTPVLAEGSLAMTVAPSQFLPGGTLHIYFTVPKAGTVDLSMLDGQGNVRATLLSDAQVDSGTRDLTWDGMEAGQALPPGEYVLHLSMNEMSVEMDVTILSAEGTAALPASFMNALEEPPGEEPSVKSQSVATGGTAMTPAYKSEHPVSPVHEACYWCTPMDITDEAAVWDMLIAPVTIVKASSQRDPQKEQVILREEPSDDSKGVGVVTCVSQSVHVLETRDDGWSLIECYSSSFHDSKVKAWNLFVTGYIKTSRLTEKTPSQDYGLIVDKLTQELYIFKDGHLFSKLLISTGLYNDRQPYNETRSGEFLFVSRVGDFRSDRMICGMALRFNSGDLLHEVPHVLNADGTKNYKNTEFKLGTRASHGCIRTQRLRNADGINMSWIWNNISLNTKFVVWEDYQGRQMPFPDPATTLYYNPNGGSSYHSTDRCNGVKDEYLPLPGSFTYGELEDSNFKSLTACTYCIPPRRVAEIEEINRIHLEQSPGEIPQHLRQEK